MTYIAKTKRVRLRGVKLKRLNDSVHERDGYKCIVCGSYIDDREKMHHEPCGIYKSDEITKTVTLCERCHYERHHGAKSAEIRTKCVAYLQSLYGDAGARKE